MYCRECIKNGKRVNMNVLIEEQAYVCPECEKRIEWNNDKENDN